MADESSLELAEPSAPLRRVLTELQAAFQFLQKGLRQFDKNASFFPSSRFLVEAMVSSAPLDRATCVVELGPGTGAVTDAILKAMRPDAHLHAIELDGALLETTTRRIDDPRLRAVHGSAADAPALLRSSGCRHETSVVFSSLGLALMNDALRDAILRATREVLSREGVFVQYCYPHARAITYQFGQGWSRFNGHSFLKGHFGRLKSRAVLLNAPPAVVYTCRQPVPLVRQAVSHDKGRARRRGRSQAGRRR